MQFFSKWLLEHDLVPYGSDAWDDAMVENKQSTPDLRESEFENLVAAIEFVFPRPKSHYGTGKNADVLKPSAPKYCTSRGNGDIDKLARSTLDGLSVSAGGSVLEDDSLVVELNTKKRYINKDELPGAYIAISSICD